MTKFLLEIEDDFDFGLIGISCHFKDYRLCHELNKILSIDFTRVADLDIDAKKSKGNFAFYEYLDEDDHQDFYLISNKSSRGFLIPELKTTDYLLMVKGANYEESLSQIVEKASSTAIVIAAYIVDVDQLKSKENLLF